MTLSMLSVKTGIYKLIFAKKISDEFIISTPMNLNYKFILDLKIKILYLKQVFLAIERNKHTQSK